MSPLRTTTRCRGAIAAAFVLLPGVHGLFVDAGDKAQASYDAEPAAKMHGWASEASEVVEDHRKLGPEANHAAVPKPPGGIHGVLIAGPNGFHTRLSQTPQASTIEADFKPEDDSRMRKMEQQKFIYSKVSLRSDAGSH